MFKRNPYKITKAEKIELLTKMGQIYKMLSTINTIEKTLNINGKNFDLINSKTMEACEYKTRIEKSITKGKKIEEVHSLRKLAQLKALSEIILQILYLADEMYDNRLKRIEEAEKAIKG